MTQLATILSRRPTFVPRGAGLAVVALTGTLVLAACSGTGNGYTHIGVPTPQGQASLSLDGKLPSHWPSNIPVPPGAHPAGSASLAGKSNRVDAAVYKSDRSAQQVYDYYTSGSSIQTTSKSALGSGSHFVGRVKVTSPTAEDVTIVPHSHGSLIVMVIPGGHGPGTTPTTVVIGSSGRE